MKKIIFIFLYLTLYQNSNILAQRKCGIEQLKASIIANHPEFKQQFENYKAETEAKALNDKEKTTAKTVLNITIPVVFHIVVNQSQYNAIGGKWGIEQRCVSQIDVLNQDFNAQNSDSTLIPALWKPLYANVGIHFGLAHTDPYGYPTPGYTVRIISGDGFAGIDSSYRNAKTTSYGGADAWDNTKYINVWCFNFTDNAFSNLLGITAPRSFTYLQKNDIGICITYNSLGKRFSATDNFPITNQVGHYYDQGRTLTHEMGHFFEIWHVWGDDGGLCPWDTGGKRVLPDIPPQGNNTYGNPVYTIPGGTINDNCKDSAAINRQPKGIACLDYMDYTDDSGMHLFTPDQAAVMISQVNNPTGESYSLTQNPELLNYPIGAPAVCNVFPNPTNGTVYITLANTASSLLQISVYNILGQEVLKGRIEQLNFSYDIPLSYNFDLSSLTEGIYIIKCQFGNSVITQPVVLQYNK